MIFNLKNQYSLLVFISIAIAVILSHFLIQPVKTGIIPVILYIFIFLSGTLFLRRSLLFFFNDTVTALTLVIITAGTNIFTLVAFDMQIQAICCYSLYSAVIFFTIAWHQRGKLHLLLLLACVVAMLIIIHPTGYISLIIPVLWNIYNKETWKEKISFLRNKKKALFLFLITLLTILIFLIVFVKILPGEIPFLNIRLPGLFLLGSRYLWDDLLSIDHGLLIYSPIIVFPLVGFFFLAENKKFAFYSVFIFCLADFFMETSWSDLAETDVFGQIAFVPMLAILSIPLASFIEKILGMKWWWKTLILFLILMLILHTFSQSRQLYILTG